MHFKNSDTKTSCCFTGSRRYKIVLGGDGRGLTKCDFTFLSCFILFQVHRNSKTIILLNSLWKIYLKWIVDLNRPFVTGQRIQTIQLEGTQYYISKMNPYSAELNYFLAYQYCRSIGLQLVAFESLEKSNTLTQYLKNAGKLNYSYIN